MNRNTPGQGRQAMNRNMGLDRWADAPVHKLQVGACAGAQLGRGALVCRCGQLCQLLCRCSACQFSATQAPRAAIGGALWPGKANKKAQCRRTSPMDHSLPTLACVPKFACHTGHKYAKDIYETYAVP